MPTFGSWVLTYLDRAARTRNGAVERDVALLRPAVQAFGGRRLDRVTRRDCEGMLIGMVAVGDAFGTMWLRCVTARKVFRLAVDDGLIDENPWDGVTLPKPVARGRVLTRGEEWELKSRVGRHWANLITVAVGTGLRGAELMNVTPAHRMAGTLRLTADITTDGKARTIPLSPDVERALEEQTPHDASARYWSCTESSASAVLRTSAMRLGWQKLTLRDLRRTFGTRCAEGGMPIARLQALMGQSNPRATAGYYAHLGEHG